MAATTASLEWLKTLGDPERADLAAPFSATLDGRRLIGATNGQAMTLVALPDEAPPFEGAQKIIDGMIALEWRPVPFSAVAQWVVTRSWPLCPTCAGIGFMATDLVAFDENGNGPIDDLYERCIDCRYSMVGTMLGVRVNRLLVQRYIARLMAEMVQIGVGERTAPNCAGGISIAPVLAIRAPNWLVLVMPYIHDDPGLVFEAQVPVEAARPIRTGGT